MGKTTFMNQILEDRLEDMGKEDLFYEVNKIRRRKKLPPYKWHAFNNNEHKGKELHKKEITELEKDKKVSISELCILMEEESDKGAEVFFIDHLHYFDIG
jgi:hypothetical protein